MQHCLCELIEGEIEYIEEPLATPDQGQVLICCSRPTSNLVIDVWTARFARASTEKLALM